MPKLTSRIERLEQAAPGERRTGWAELHANMRLVYGDGQRYSDAELARLDSVPPPTGERFAELWQQAQAMNARGTNELQP
jgi:hypothetical protein